MEQEGIIRLSIFFGLFFIFAAIEYIFPRRTIVKVKPGDGSQIGRLLY